MRGARFLLLLAVCMSAACDRQTPTAIGQGGREAFSAREVSVYRKALDEPQVKTRGLQASTDVAELFSHYDASNFDRALENIQGMIRKLRDQGELSKADLAIALDFRGVIFQRQGKLHEALDSHKEAVELLRAMGAGRAGERARAHNNLAVTHLFLGDYEESEKLLSDILADERLPAMVRARALNNRGLIRVETGRGDSAFMDFVNARAEARSEKTPQSQRVTAEIFNNEARILAEKKDREGAQDALKKALELARKSGDPALEANVLDSWAEMLAQAGEFQPALEKLNAAAAAEAKAKAPLVRAAILKNRGRVLAGLGKSEEARKTYADALQASNDLGLMALRREILASRARLEVQLNRLDAALDDYREAINIAESTRERLRGQSESSFIHSTRALYAETISLLLRRKAAGDVEQAMSYLERSQSAALQEQLVQVTPELRDREATQVIRGARGVLRREAALVQQLQARLGAPEPNGDEITKLRQQLAEVRREVVRALGELENKYKGRYGHFVSAAINPKLFADIHHRLPPKSLMVSFSFGDEGLYFFLTSRDGNTEFRQNLNVKKADLESKIAEYRRLVTQSPGFSREDWKVNSWSDPKWVPLRDATVWLHQQLLAPIADRIEEVDQLVIAPTGLMYYLPFHALGPFDANTGEIGFLALRKKVSYVAPGSLLKSVDADAGASRRLHRQPRILALGDVKFERLKPLAYAKDELTAIRKLFAEAAVLLDGPRATKNELLRALSDGSARERIAPDQTAGKRSSSPAGFTFVHVVTHGILDARNPQESRLALEGSNSLKTYEIARLDLRGVSLVTLSACDTALARENPGADLMSLGEYVSLAGAASVVVSLWSVDDLETKNLMNAFYARLRQDGNDKVAALQRAQAELSKRPESRHPFYWAAFVLYGRGW